MARYPFSTGSNRHIPPSIQGTVWRTRRGSSPLFYRLAQGLKYDRANTAALIWPHNKQERTMASEQHHDDTSEWLVPFALLSAVMVSIAATGGIMVWLTMG